MSDNQSKFAIFQNADGEPTVAARFEDDDVWLTQDHLALLYKTSKPNVVMHIKSILDSGEISESTAVKKFLIPGKRFGKAANLHILHYNLDMIIALGYRIDSPIAIKFRQWATTRLHEYIQKGFAMDDERLKQGGNRYFKELLQDPELSIQQALADYRRLGYSERWIARRSSRRSTRRMRARSTWTLAQPLCRRSDGE